MADLELLMDEIWQQIGEPDDIDPDTDVQYEGSPLLMWVCNEAQRRIAMWKDPSTNHRTRIRSLISDLYFSSTYYDEDLDDDATDESQIILPAADVSDEDDCYNGWVLEINNEARVIIDYDGTSYTATVNEDFSSTPEEDDGYKLYKNFYYLMPSTHAWVDEHISLPSTTDTTRATGNLLEVLKIVDLNQSRTIPKGRGSYYPAMNMTSPGEPGDWIRVGNKIIFDKPQSEDYSFYMEYYRTPMDMAGNDSEPEIPEMYHYAIVLWGMWWGFNRQQDFTSAWAKKQDFNEFMKSISSQYELASERGETYGSLQKD